MIRHTGQFLAILHKAVQKIVLVAVQFPDKAFIRIQDTKTASSLAHALAIPNQPAIAIINSNFDCQ